MNELTGLFNNRRDLLLDCSSNESLKLESSFWFAVQTFSDTTRTRLAFPPAASRHALKEAHGAAIESAMPPTDEPHIAFIGPLDGFEKWAKLHQIGCFSGDGAIENDPYASSMVFKRPHTMGEAAVVARQAWFLPNQGLQPNLF